MKAADYQLSHFELDQGQQDTLEYAITKILNSVVNKADTMTPKTFGGKIKKAIAKTFIDKKKLHKKVPEFSRTIVREMLKAQNKRKLKYLVESKLKQLGKSTYDSIEADSVRAVDDGILKKYNVSSIAAFNSESEKQTSDLTNRTLNFTFLTIGIMIMFLVLWILVRNQTQVHKPFFIISIILAIVVLVVGLSTPMIEIDARIKSIDFHLMGQQVSFHDQVIFFQSKSIIDVVHVLLKTGKYDSFLVGILILVFSIVFPFSKLFSEGAYLMNEKWKGKKLIKFFAFKSGKWSMADVNVIAIFMAYIGFKGILDDQLKSLDIKNDSLTSISTNHTTLQPGYILFVGFVLFGLVLSVILDKITNNEAKVL
jgi:hypothetical protein